MQGKTLCLNQIFQTKRFFQRYDLYSLLALYRKGSRQHLYDKKTLKKGTFLPTHTYLCLLTRDSYETKMYSSVLTEIKWNEIKTNTK